MRHRRSSSLGHAAEVDEDSRREDADELAAALEAMGPTFVKLGQLLSTPARAAGNASRQNRIGPAGRCEVQKSATVAHEY
jgi:predicted unusual protein kinase regulating ubiquinone biosynthesis (AarF/ABC1/UbiB family)